MSYRDFTSLPPDQEQHFVVFEQQSVENSKKSMTIGIVAGALVALFLVILYATSEAPPSMHTDALDSDMAAEKADSKPKSKSTAPAPAPKEAPPAAVPAEGAAAPTEAPPPPAGATKAPPTAVVGQ